MSDDRYKGWYYTVLEIKPERSSYGTDIAAKDVCLPLKVRVGAMQDSIHKDCEGVRAAVSVKKDRPPCNPMATQCPRCRNVLAECDFCETGDLLTRCREMIADNLKVDAIRLYRDETGSTLLEAAHALGILVPK